MKQNRLVLLESEPEATKLGENGGGVLQAHIHSECVGHVRDHIETLLRTAQRHTTLEAAPRKTSLLRSCKDT